MAKFIPRKPEKEVISMRIAVDTLQEIDRKSRRCRYQSK